MKKLALVLTIFTASIYGVNAQIQVGIKAGANFAKLTGDGADGAKNLTGFHAGALVNIGLGGGLSLQPEAIFSAQGAKASDGGTDVSLHLDYVNIPVLVKYQLPVGVFFETGPQLGLRMSAKAKSGGESQDLKDYYKSSDFAWAFGAGFKIPALPLGIDVRYNLGLANVVKVDGGGTQKNGVFQVGVFALFGGGKK